MVMLAHAYPAYYALGRWRYGKSWVPFELKELDAIIPSTFQTVIILGIMAAISIILIDFLYKKRGE